MNRGILTLRSQVFLFSKFRTIRRAQTNMINDLKPLNRNSELVIILAGATSAGKSAVARELCKLVDAEIIIGDSVQIYKYMDIGANKPSVEEQNAVPHHLIDMSEPAITITAGDFCRSASKVIHDILQRGKVPIVVGGSTMWMQWLMHGIPDAPAGNAETTLKSHEMLKDFELNQAWEGAVDLVRQYDPLRAEKLCRNDWYRLRRYLEIALVLRGVGSGGDSSESITGANLKPSSSSEAKEEVDVDDNASVQSSDSVRSLTGARSPFLSGLDVRCFFLTEEREELYRTIDDRCEQMLHKGLVSEVAEMLLQDRLRPEYTVWKAIGYRQTVEYLLYTKQDKDLGAFKEYINDFATATRNFAKRQIAWYRKDPLFLFLRIAHTKWSKPVKKLGKKKARFAPPPVPGPKGRSRDDVDTEAYCAVTAEVAHWASLPREEYQAVLRDQKESAALYCELMEKKHIPRNFKVEDDFSRRVLCRMAAAGVLDLPDLQWASEEERRGHWSTQLRDGSKGVTPSTVANEEPSPWTAQELQIRITDAANKQSKMKEYLSDFKRKSDWEMDSARYGGLVDEADALRAELRDLKPDLADLFRNHNPNMGAIKSDSDDLK